MTGIVDSPSAGEKRGSVGSRRDDAAAVPARPRVILAGIGTHGDVVPLAALGGELARRGYACDLLSNAGYEALAQRHGLSFRAVTVPQTNNLVSGQENLDQHVFPSYEPTFAHFDEVLRRGERPVVVNLDECSASNLMCERYQLPLCRLVLAPSRFNSVFRPSWPLNEKLRGPLAHTYRLYRLPQIYARMERAPFVLGRINPFRARLGLPPLERFSQINAPVQRRLAFFPAWFGEPQPDWPADVVLVGFPLPPGQGPLAPELQAFIEREGRPLVFTPGTGVVRVESFFADARRCCERLNRPGVFLSPHLQGEEPAASRIYRAPFVELQALARSSALLVHHGGIGTTARALEAGIPQIIRAEAYDQPDNGDRVTQRGVGAFFAPGRYSFDRLVAEAERLLGDAGVKQRLEQLSRDVRQTDAIAAAADAIEGLVKQQASVRAA